MLCVTLFWSELFKNERYTLAFWLGKRKESIADDCSSGTRNISQASLSEGKDGLWEKILESFTRPGRWHLGYQGPKESVLESSQDLMWQSQEDSPRHFWERKHLGRHHISWKYIGEGAKRGWMHRKFSNK